MTTEIASQSAQGRNVRRTTVLLPEPRGVVPPVTARRMRRAVLGYAVAWLLGLLPALLGAGPSLVALGLGVIVPGGGLLATGHPLWELAAAVIFVLSLAVWWFAAPVVLPPLVWLAAAVASACTATAQPVPVWRVAAIAALAPVLLIGDQEYAAAAQATLDEREPVASANGALRYVEASALTNLYGVLGRFGRPSGLRDLLDHGAPDAWLTGPRLAGAAYPDVLVARAVTDGRALDLTLVPGGGPVRTTLALDRLTPHRTYTTSGARADTVTADADGHALMEVDLGGRLEIRVH